MKIFLIIPALLCMSMPQVHGLVTEKLVAHADKIAELQCNIKSGTLNAPACYYGCRKRCKICSRRCGKIY